MKGTPRGEYQNWSLSLRIYIYIVVPQCFAKHRMILTTSKTHTCWSSFFKWCTEVYLCCFFAGNWLGVVNPMINQPLFYQTLVSHFQLDFLYPTGPKRFADPEGSPSLSSPRAFSVPSPPGNQSKSAPEWSEPNWSLGRDERIGIYAKDLRWFYHLKPPNALEYARGMLNSSWQKL